VTTSLCELLEWDTRFWGLPVAKVTGNTVTNDTIKLIDDWSQLHGVRCLYFLARSDEPITPMVAENNGFRFVDARVTLAWSSTQVAQPARHPSITLRSFQPDDLDSLEAIARVSHSETRFYYDRHFPRHLCDLLYMTWIRVSCEDSSQRVLVADSRGQAVGYVTCQLDLAGSGQIGLVGIAEHARGQGIGQALIGNALGWFRSQGAREVIVVTQARNVAAQRLYQQARFRTSKLELWFHKWYEPTA